ncbi:hypothetical protein [Actinomadura sp. KC216]|uniref:hypothetical protein n=1 Tax=Actinomadura sp. KC216 TaxID=2530370 RepID=UPI001A9EF1C1|nr:hypothetical protein [Actinomadura sp. KC216]
MDTRSARECVQRGPETTFVLVQVVTLAADVAGIRFDDKDDAECNGVAIIKNDQKGHRKHRGSRGGRPGALALDRDMCSRGHHGATPLPGSRPFWLPAAVLTA